MRAGLAALRCDGYLREGLARRAAHEERHIRIRCANVLDDVLDRQIFDCGCRCYQWPVVVHEGPEIGLDLTCLSDDLACGVPHCHKCCANTVAHADHIREGLVFPFCLSWLRGVIGDRSLGMFILCRCAYAHRSSRRWCGDCLRLLIMCHCAYALRSLRRWWVGVGSPPILFPPPPPLFCCC